MLLPDDPAYTRREFLGRSLTLASATIAVPAFLQKSALALPRPGHGVASVPGAPEDRVLVVVQLSGGNDGLNTIVPIGHDPYYRLRPSIAIRRDEALTVPDADDVALHPALADLMALYDDGSVAVVQGIGYPNPNRSHFKSMDIWHTADLTATGDGWLGRYFDAECSGQDVPAGHAGIAVGRDSPLAMHGREVQPITFESPDLFRWTGNDIHESLREPYERLAGRAAPAASERDSNADFLLRTAVDAQVSSAAIRRAVSDPPLVDYPRTSLARQLAMVAAMIRADLRTRVYYVTLGGFDTHAGQGGTRGRHAALLGQFAAAMKAFYDDLTAQANAARVLTMIFSEFGRRVGQNASGGTDHGAAAPLLLLGPMVRPGILTPHPSLTDLDAGDLHYTVDFRCVYATVLGRWLGAGDTRTILNGDFTPAPVLKDS